MYNPFEALTRAYSCKRVMILTTINPLALLKQSDAEKLRRLVREGKLSSLSPEDKVALPHEAARLGRTDMLQALCEDSHVITLACDGNGRDLLHYAAMSGNVSTIAYTVDKLGYDPFRGDKHGVTALDIASQGGHTEAVRWLENRMGFTLAESYRNPVRRGFYPDPSVVRVGEDYYMVNSTFVQFPCLPVSHSRDLVSWQTIGHAITNLAWSGLEGLPGGFGYWAPDISYYKGRFWIIATLRRDTAPFRLQMITSAERPEGPYEKPRFLDINGIDPSIFTDDDGRRYIVINPGAQIVEINDQGDMIAQPEMIYYGSARIKTEGPHLLKKDGWYYLFQAEGGTGSGHMETVARSRTLRGPYEPCPFNPILGRKEAEAPVRRSGHGKPFATPDGRWYMLYLCGRDVDGKTMLGRETALDPMTWTQDGWPMVNGLKGPSCVQRRPLCAAPHAEEGLRPEDFITPRNDPRTFATPVQDGWRLCAGLDPQSLSSVNMLLRRQSERRFVQCVQVDASEMASGVAGLCGYYDENSFYIFGIARTDDGWMLTVEEQIGSERKATQLMRWPAHTVQLRVTADGRSRSLACLTEHGWQELLTLDAVYLSDEGVRTGKRFTGATQGIVAVGCGHASFTGYQEQMIKDDGNV